MMKEKKLYTGPIFRGLNHEKAKCKCLLNPDLVLTRREWKGYHFVRDNEYYMMLKTGEVVHVGNVGDEAALAETVWDINNNDWVVAFRNRQGQELENRFFNCEEE